MVTVTADIIWSVFLLIFRNFYFCRTDTSFCVLLIRKEFLQTTRRLLVVSAHKHQRSFSMSSGIAGKWSAVNASAREFVLASFCLFVCLLAGSVKLSMIFHEIFWRGFETRKN